MGLHAVQTSKRQGSASQARIGVSYEGSARTRRTVPTQSWPELVATDPGRGDCIAGPHVASLVADIPTLPSFHLKSSELQPSIAGSGFSGFGLNVARGLSAVRVDSPSPTVADGASVMGDLQTASSSNLPSTRQPSGQDNISPDDAFRRFIMEERRKLLNLDTNEFTQAAAAVGLEGEIPGGKALVTPPYEEIPSLSAVSRIVKDATDVVESLERQIIALPTGNSPGAGCINDPSETKQSGTEGLPDAIQGALQRIPDAISRLPPLLAEIQSQLSRHPDISIHESLITLSRRMDALENFSFNQLPADQITQQFDHMDLRLVELETKIDEHGRLLAGADSDTTRRITANENISFASTQSLDSATSSALIAAAIDRAEIVERLIAVEERLDKLESVQLPSSSAPWEMEVVLLPWGRDLRGIWCMAEEPTRPGMTQDEDGCLNYQNEQLHHSESIAVCGIRSSSSAIQDRVSNDGCRLWPKACSTNSIIYHRLKSRGLVRRLNIYSSASRDIMSSVCEAFGDTLTNANGLREKSGLAKPAITLGFTAPFIPLRKVHKSSELRFLSEAELATPALWTAGFLASGVVMRAPGGEKRLFITTRQGYEQGDDRTVRGWTWARLRALSRVRALDTEQSTAGDVLEADAREPCWKHHPTLDADTSAVSSFRSHISVSESFRKQPDTISSPTDRQPGKEPNNNPEDEPAAVLHQPITPISEFPPTQPSPEGSRHMRTLSATFSDPLATPHRIDPLSQPVRPFSQQSKRRVRSFETAANPALIAALPSFVPFPAKPSRSSSRVKKRRRLTQSRSASPSDWDEETAMHSSGQADVESLHPGVDPEQVLRHLQDRVPLGGEIKPLGRFEPRRRGPGSVAFELEFAGEGRQMSAGREAVGLGRGRGRRGFTPSAYATPFSGTAAGTDGESEVVASDEDWNGVEEEVAVDDGIGGGDDDGEDVDDDEEGDEDQEEADDALFHESDDHDDDD